MLLCALLLCVFQVEARRLDPFNPISRLPIGGPMAFADRPVSVPKPNLWSAFLRPRPNPMTAKVPMMQVVANEMESHRELLKARSAVWEFQRSKPCTSYGKKIETEINDLLENILKIHKNIRGIKNSPLMVSVDFKRQVRKAENILKTYKNQLIRSKSSDVQGKVNEMAEFIDRGLATARSSKEMYARSLLEPMPRSLTSDDGTVTMDAMIAAPEPTYTGLGYFTNRF